ITHEFRTPLTLIIGPLEQLKQENLPLLFKRRLNGVLNNARHLLDLINQLLDISKLEGGRMQVEVSRGDLVLFTYSLVDRFQPIADKKNLRIALVSNLETWETCFDKDKWNKIVYNLISNAIKFTPENGAIQISLGRQIRQGKEHIFLAVKDNGIGISENNLPHIFDRFYQSDDSSTRLSGGTGIGLALVKELVELEGGTIEVASEVGKGATFKLWLPVLEQEINGLAKDYPVEELPLPAFDLTAPAAAEIFKPGEPAGLLELLIVEDNEEMREYVRYCLDASKYNITEAGNGEEGLEKALSIIPDLIISDVMMPKMDGYAFTQAIRSNLSTSHIPVILLTAKASLESRLEGLRRGADAYLTKPFSPQELALCIQKLIEIRLLLQKRYQDSLSPTAADETFEQEDAFILELKTYILENLDEADLNGDIIGRHFGMSRVHLFRKLKALTNSSISELVKSVRLERAVELLREGKLNISEITWQTGFSSPSVFSRAFKEVYGKTPSEYS
ncbi:MAG: ATP-binding protein, partial [Saprospiraceae bacterium]